MVGKRGNSSTGWSNSIYRKIKAKGGAIKRALVKPHRIKLKYLKRK